MRSAGLPTLITTIARSFAAAVALTYLYDLLQRTHDHLPNGAARPFGDDFINLWSGAYLAWHGRVTETYNPGAVYCRVADELRRTARRFWSASNSVESP